MPDETRVGDFETVEERYGGGVGQIQDAEMAWANACSTELEPGAEAEVLDGAISTARDLQHEVEYFIKALEKVRDAERRAEHEAWVKKQAATNAQ